MSDGNTTQLQNLLDRAAAGDSSAYADLIAQAEDRLLRLTRRMLHGYARLRRWEETDDVFQDAAMRLHRALADVRPESVRGFFGLAATQIRRTLIDLSRRHFGPEGWGANHQTDGPEDTVDGPDGRVRGAAARIGPPGSLADWTAFHEAVESLPTDEREVFQLTWYAGLPQADIARLLGVSIPTVRRRWRAARVALYYALGGESPRLD